MTLAAAEHWNSAIGGHLNGRRSSSSPTRATGYWVPSIFAKKSCTATRDFTCLLGTVVEEMFDTQQNIRDAPTGDIARHAHNVARDIAAARTLCVPDAPWDPQVLARFTQAPLRGAFVLTKVQGSATIVAQCINHLRQHVANLLGAHPGLALTQERTP
jgi:TetR/AcrR family transcriptional regulator, transcriptional repressor for nem operon